MEDLIIIEDSPSLPSVVSAQEIATCNAQAAYVAALAGQTLTQSYILGAMLHSVKEKCKHGEWGKLFGKANSHHGVNFNFGQNMALRYIQLFQACGQHAERQGVGEQLRELLSYTTGPMDGAIDVAAKVEELGSMLHSLTGGASSMRQALFAFMEEETAEREEAEDFFRGKRNKKGRRRKGRELSAEEVLERKKQENFEALSEALDTMQAELAAGRHLLLPAGARGRLIQTAQEILDTLIKDHGN